MPLLAVLILQAVCTLSLGNTAFSDEALYIDAGHRILDLWFRGRPIYDAYGTYFSGAPFLYPVVAASLDSVGGLEAVRALSLAMMLAATVCLHAATRRLFDLASSHVAALIFASSQPVLFMGGLATYDAMAVLLLAVALWAVTTAGRGLWGTWLLAIPTAALAVGVKYAAALYVVPVVGIAVLMVAARASWLRAVLAGAVMVLGIGGIVAVGYALAPDIHGGVAFSTSSRAPGVDSSRLVLTSSATQIGAALVAAGLGAVALWGGYRRIYGSRSLWPGRIMSLGLLLTGLAAPLHQAQLHTTVSLHKHNGYGLMFVAPLAGLGLAYLLGRRSTGRLIAVLALLLAMSSAGFVLAQRRYADWPRTDDVTELLRTQVRPGVGRYLVEEAEVQRYYLRDITEGYQWYSTFYFEYEQEGGPTLFGAPAYRQAIKDQYFDVVVLRYGPTAELDVQIDGDLKSGTGYSLVGTITADSSYGPATYFVWRRN